MFNKSRIWNNIKVILNFTKRGYQLSIVPVKIIHFSKGLFLVKNR